MTSSTTPVTTMAYCTPIARPYVKTYCFNPVLLFPMRLTASQRTQRSLQSITFVRAAMHPFSVQLSTNQAERSCFLQNLTQNVLRQRLEHWLVCSRSLGRQRLKQQLAFFNTTWSPEASTCFETGLAEWLLASFLCTATTLTINAN